MSNKHLSLVEYKSQVLVVLNILILNVDHSLLGSLVDLESGQTTLSREIVDEVLIGGKVVVGQG